MNTLILYTTKTGATEKYANWMKEEIEECTIQNIEHNPEINFEPYQRIIFALPTYGGQINKKDVLEKCWDQIQSKAVYLVVVGGVPQDSSWSQMSYNTIKKEVRDNLKGYVKIIGLSANQGKKIGRIGKFFSKLFLKIDPAKLENRKEVFKEDLKRVWEMLGVSLSGKDN